MIEERDIELTKDQNVFLYKKGTHTDVFILILQGRVEVTVGQENIVFEDGPFSVFGTKALTCESGHQFHPDYTVKILTDVQYLKVARSLYRSAIRASKMERENKTPDNYHEYDEIFWNHLKKTTKDTNVVDISSHKSDVSSVDNASERGTPNKHERKNKGGSLMRRLNPKFDKKKDQSNTSGEDTNSIDSPSFKDEAQANPNTPLISYEVEPDVQNSVC